MIGYINGNQISFSDGSRKSLGSSDDLNNVRKNGQYFIYGNAPKNCPNNWCVLRVIAFDDNLCTQILIAGNQILFRELQHDPNTGKLAAGTSPWVKVQTANL